MADNKFLQRMEGTNCATDNLMRWDRKRVKGEGLAVERLSLFQRYEIMLQVVHAREDAIKVWTSVYGFRPKETELHWPDVLDLELFDNGGVKVFPESLVNPVSSTSHTFQHLVRELLGIEYRDATQKFTTFLFQQAGKAFCGSSAVGMEWEKHFHNMMSARLEEVCGSMEHNHRVPQECTKAVLQLMTKDDVVTLENFCKSTLLFGTWWEGAMLKCLIEVVNEKNHFYIATSKKAVENIGKYNGLGYIIRPRCTEYSRGDGAKWPFALTMLVDGAVREYVVAYVNGMFEVTDEDGRATRDSSIVNLARRFAESHGVKFTV